MAYFLGYYLVIHYNMSFSIHVSSLITPSLRANIIFQTYLIITVISSKILFFAVLLVMRRCTLCITVSQEPQWVRFRRVFTCSPIVSIRIKQCILPSFVSSMKFVPPFIFIKLFLMWHPLASVLASVNNLCWKILIQYNVYK